MLCMCVFSSFAISLKNAIRFSRSCILSFQHSTWVVECELVVIEDVIKWGKIFLLYWQAKLQGKL